MKNSRKGFTLVEILIVVMVIIILATILIPNIIRVRLIANEAIAQTTLKTIATALENYINDNQIYPTDPNNLLTAAPSYLNTDFFSGTHVGYSYTPKIEDYVYQITAQPVNANTGLRTFTMTTGGVFQ